ncbi:MAG TPA: hypothetical protein VJQ52_04510 [Steroidobacteraceae bacterium]|nr:hypothetical protein [Steroidobacteraceae bacterium]
MPRMADGTPDIQGIWTSGTLTPFERPADLATQLPEAQRAEHQRVAAEKFWASGHKAGEVGRDNDAFIDQHLAILPNGQTSLVVEPADGKVPVRPEALRRRDFNLSNFDSYETMSQWDRCITREPTAMFPVVYNNAYQFVQTPGYVLIVAEMVHDARVIRMDSAAQPAHADRRVRSWGGDSRGHWEGATLVVDTTNFNDRGWIATGQNSSLRGVPFSEQLHLIERFTRIDRDTMQYEITIDDPVNYTAPWKISYPLARDEQYQMFEYACHEGNSAVELILRGARVQEKMTTR